MQLVKTSMPIAAVETPGSTAESVCTKDYQEQTNKICSDHALVQKVQAGDKRAFDLLVLKYQHKVAMHVSRIVNDQHEVQDVTQQTFINAYRGLKNFRGESAVYTWLYRIAKNTALMHLRHVSRRPPCSGVCYDNAEQFDSVTGLRDIADPHSELVTDQIVATVTAAMKTLPVDLHSALSLREFKGLSYEEIALVMKCPIGTVRSRISRARAVIEQQIQPLLDNTI